MATFPSRLIFALQIRRFPGPGPREAGLLG
jgi:hypothetical protein